MPHTLSKTVSKGLGVHTHGNEVFFYYRLAKDDLLDLQVLSSQDGISTQTLHTNAIIKDRDSKPEHIETIETMRISELGAMNVLCYTQRSKGLTELILGLSKDVTNWTRIGPIKGIRETGMVVPNHYEDKSFALIYGQHDIRIATSPDILNWTVSGDVLLPAMEDQWGTLSLIVGTIVPMESGFALLYFARGIGGSHWSIHGAMLDKKNPKNILWRSDTIWENTHGWEGKKVEPVGMAYKDNQLLSYWDFAGEGLFALTHSAFHGLMNKKASFSHLILNRIKQNPVVKPVAENFWESRATFNAAAVYDQEKVHLVYRAIGDFDTSVLGYAASKDGYNFDERSHEPVYIPTQAFEMPAGGIPWKAGQVKKDSPYESGGGGYGGVEDPRITKIDNRYYLTYVAYDGANPPRVALSSISEEDFHSKNWNWDKPVLISPPGVVDKNCVIFPEKINGKYAIMHRIYPNILIDYVDSLDFDGKTYLKGEFRIKPSRTLWDSRKVGAGPPPIKTPYGWLLIYHAVGEHDAGRYKIGAMLLDLIDPTKILARTILPILAPDDYYENEGFKAGVAYPCGAIIKDDQLMVYYGGADSYVCAAHAHIDNFLHQLIETGGTNRKPVYLPANPQLYAHNNTV